MSIKQLSEDAFFNLIDDLNSKGTTVVAPVRNQVGMVQYEKVTSSKDNFAFDEVIGRYSPKDAFFPQHETVLCYREGENGMEIKAEEPEINDTVLLGIRPCDAAAMISLNKVFTWDYIDTLFTERQRKAVIISIACNEADESCYCTSVGFAPDGKEGSDLLFSKIKGGGYLAEALTEEGEAFIANNSTCFSKKDKSVELEPIAEVTDLGVNIEHIKKWLDKKENFEHKVWDDLAAKCVGCGGCTFVCPTCHCFDIVDEPYGDQGKRVKNWDGCQFDHFTLHASGHNPREHQPQRWRNRFHCKFKIYPDRFEKKGCVGCGRCIRVCPVNVDITEAMTEITELAT